MIFYQYDDNFWVKTQILMVFNILARKEKNLFPDFSLLH